MAELQIVDFNKSNVSWLGDSTGIFKLASILSVCCKGREPDIFTLTESVLAGNVYAKKDLIKNPPYLFQLVASNNYQKILRTDLCHDISELHGKNISRQEILDTEGNLFRENINVDVRYKDGRLIDDVNAIEKCSTGFSLNGHLSLNRGQYQFAIEFPIRHLNMNAKRTIWQVETGPILFPVFSKNKKNFSFSPSFLFFGSFNKVDVFLDYPLKRRIFSQYKDNMISDLECDISLFKEQ